MTPEAQKWRAHFAQCEEEQLRHFPLHKPATSLERAQYEVALDYLRKKLPTKLSHLEEPIVFWAAEITREAVFDYFEPDLKNRPFCLKSDTAKAVFNAFPPTEAEMPDFWVQHHEFIPCTQMEQGMIDIIFRKRFPDQEGRETLFCRSFGSSFSGSEELWKWNGTNLVLLPEHSSQWIF